MGTLVCFHAHPDDESIATGGTLARAAAEGHRTVLVVATGGEHGEVPGDLAPGEELAVRRRRETECSAGELGISRIVWLDYRDSGMTGWPQNDDPLSFWRADVEAAAARLAAVLVEERADVLTTYDWHGGYGHPDHIQVHRVGHRAAVLASTPAVFESTMNRDAMTRLIGTAVAAGLEADGFDPNAPADDGNPFGTPESELTHRVDVGAYVARKQRSIRCHASQITDSGFFAAMPDEVFATAFGTEWFIRVGATHPLRDGWLFE